jgi:gluconate:H+ symporter, GntP family
MPIELRDAAGIPEADTAPPLSEPPLALALLPIALPVLLISLNTVVASMAVGPDGADGMAAALAPYTAILGNSNLALLLATVIAMWTYRLQRNPSRAEMSNMVETSLMSGGVIILITAAGGAFGAMLQAAEIGPAIRDMFGDSPRGPGMGLLFLAFAVASLLKIAQGSSTVAMITSAGMLAAMITGAGPLPFHPVYVATSISSGALVGSWMNDSGFWIFTKMGGLTEAEALKTWTPLLALVGVTSMAGTLLLAWLVPLV